MAQKISKFGKIAKDFSYGEYSAIEDEWNKFKEKHGGDGSAGMALQFIDEECSDIYDEEECDMIFNYIGILEENDANKSTNKSKKVNKMAKNKAIRKEMGDMDVIDRFEKEYDSIYEFVDDLPYELYCDIIDYGREKYETEDEYGASTKKSRMSELHKKLNKIGGFTKEDDEDDEGDDSARWTGHPADWEEEEDEIIEDETVETKKPKDEIEEACKGCKGKKSRKMKKEELDYDADDQQDQNEKGSGNAGSELPEDADENEEINEKGSGSAGKELPEDADEQENIKESRRKSARKNVRKFSVTSGGSADQTSYIQRYNQNPMVRNAIDGKSNVEKFDEVGMLQERLNELNKSKRNKGNNVPQRLR